MNILKEAWPGGLTVLLALVIPAPSLRAQVDAPSGRDVMELYQLQEHTSDTEVAIEMTLVDTKGRERRRELSLLTKTRDDGTRLQLIRFEDPADVAGTGFLTIENRDRDDDAWLYLPALRRTRRIAGTQKQDRFVGTDFTFEDLDPEVLADHDYLLLREEVADGAPSWVVEATPVDEARAGASGYGRRELWITKDHAVLVRAKLYDRSGTFVRRLSASDVREVPGTGRWRPHRILMEDVREGSRTLLEIKSYEIDQGLEESLFTERYLVRGRR